MKTGAVTVRIEIDSRRYFAGLAVTLAATLLAQHGAPNAVHVAEAQAAKSEQEGDQTNVMLYREAARLLERGFVAGKMMAARFSR